MSSKKALLTSSLTVCTASTSLAMSADPDAVAHAEDKLQQTEPLLPIGSDINKSLYQYLKPVSLSMLGKEAKEWRGEKQGPITYTVKKGDTLYRIGLYYGVHFDILAAHNQITNIHQLRIGQKLQIPIEPKWVESSGDETVEQLAQKYQSTTILLTELNPYFRKHTKTELGQWILVPIKSASLTQNTTPTATQITQLSHRAGKQKVLKLADHQRKQTGQSFLWPVKGQITSKFGSRWGRQHKGIDIWNSAESRTLIYASKGGVVTRAGYSGGYGNLVVVDHGNGWQTYYAHLSRIGVSKGQHVTAGEVVGNMGSTGNSTGYHLHFEVRKDGEALNPLSILP